MAVPGAAWDLCSAGCGPGDTQGRVCPRRFVPGVPQHVRGAGITECPSGSPLGAMSAAGGTLGSVLSLGAPRHARAVMCGDEQHWAALDSC